MTTIFLRDVVLKGAEQMPESQQRGFKTLYAKEGNTAMPMSEVVAQMAETKLETVLNLINKQLAKNRGEA